MEGGRCGSWKDVLPWTSPDQDAKELDTRSIAYPEWKGDGVVLGRMFCSKPLLIKNQSDLATRIISYPPNGRGMVWFLEGCGALNLSSSGTRVICLQGLYPTLNGRGIVWFLEGCSALNLSSSGNSCTRLRSCKLFPPPVVQICNKIIDICMDDV